MKEKRLVAMFISSIVAFVASLSISIGVAVAFAEPVAATGLGELKYTVAATDTSANYQSFVFSPVAAYNDGFDEEPYGVFVNSYDDVQWVSGAFKDSIKLIKIAIVNDSDDTLAFVIKTELSTDYEGANKLVENAYVKLFATTPEPIGIIDLNPADTDSTIRSANSETNEMHIPANSTGYYIMATYVSDAFADIDWGEFAPGGESAGSYMTMKVDLEIKYR